MRIPAIVLNFKTYSEALGKKGWDLATRVAAVADDTGASIVLCPPTGDLAHVAKLVHIPVFAQHVDAVEAGPTTGWSPPEALLEAGAAGTLINHSERKVAWEEMAKSIPRCQELGLEVVACGNLAEGVPCGRPRAARSRCRTRPLAMLDWRRSPRGSSRAR